jgi:hypothetical protein
MQQVILLESDSNQLMDSELYRYWPSKKILEQMYIDCSTYQRKQPQKASLCRLS